MPIRVLIADDHAMVRRGLTLILGQQEDLQIVGEAGDVFSVPERCAELKPDVLLLDLSMPGGDALKMLDRLHRQAPATRVVVLSMHDDPTTVRAALAAGVSGYVVKTAGDGALISAIRAVAAGRTFLDVPLRDAQTQEVVDRAAERGGEPASLSAREEEVLKLLARGHTNQEVADRLFLSVKTIETYRARLSDKLGLKSRAELTRYAAAQGWLDP